MYVTASLLYDYLQCPHKVWRDIYGPLDEKNPETNPFVKLLWEKGVQHEKDAISGIGFLLDLSSSDKEAQFQNTLKAMRNKVPLIYHGYIRWKNLSGEPDLLRLSKTGFYEPIDIKSGRGLEGVSEDDDQPGKPKKHYAVQLALYTEILIALGFTIDKTGFIFDIDNKEITYQLDQSVGVRNKKSLWEVYQEVKNEVGLLIENKQKNTPAIAGVCKLCPWYESCRKWCIQKQDLSNVFFLGRSKRQTLEQDLGIERVEELCIIDIPTIIEKKLRDKYFLYKIGESTLKSIKKRATVLTSTKKPVIYQEITFPKVSYELFFDIEDDPTQGFVYLHGIYERKANSQKFIPFIAKKNTRKAEKEAWKQIIEYIRSLPKDNFCLYFYSKHEITNYKKLQQQYPDIISSEELDNIFKPNNAIDLYYDIILKNSDWPLSSYSLKDIAHYLKFNWRDKTPSGALSIQWYNEYLKDEDPKKLQRIIEYNEDDCKAAMVIKDFLAGVINA